MASQPNQPLKETGFLSRISGLTFFLICVAAGLVGGMVLFLVFGLTATAFQSNADVLMAVCGFLLGFALPIVYLKRRRRHAREARITSQIAQVPISKLDLAEHLKSPSPSPSSMTKLSSTPMTPAKVGIIALIVFVAVTAYSLFAGKQSPLDCMSDTSQSLGGNMWGRVSCAVRTEDLTISAVTINRGICKPDLDLDYKKTYRKGDVISVYSLCTILEFSIASNKGTWTWNFK